MFLWFLFAVVSLLLAYFASDNNKITTHTSLFQILLAIWLSWFVSFGGADLVDFRGYQNHYELAANDALSDFLNINLIDAFSDRISQEMEIGYTFLNILFNKLGFSFVGFLFLFNLITNLLLIKFIYRYPFPVFSILILIGSHYYSNQANLIRQMMAISIFLYSTKYIVNRNFFKFLFAIVLGATIHLSLILVMPVYFFLNRNIWKILMIPIWLFSIYVNFYSIKFNFSFLSSAIIPNTNYILNSSNNLDVGINSISLSTVLNLFVFILIVFKNRVKNNPTSDNIVINLFFLGAVITNLIVISPWLMRFSLYFIVSMIVFIPQIPRMIQSSNLMRTKKEYFVFAAHYTLLTYYSFTLIRAILVSQSVISLGGTMSSVFDIFK